MSVQLRPDSNLRNQLQVYPRAGKRPCRPPPLSIELLFLWYSSMRYGYPPFCRAFMRIPQTKRRYGIKVRNKRPEKGTEGMKIRILQNGSPRRWCAVLLLAVLVSVPLCAQQQMPRLEHQDGRFALLVDGQPYLMLGAQVDNSSGW